MQTSASEWKEESAFHRLHLLLICLIILLVSTAHVTHTHTPEGKSNMCLALFSPVWCHIKSLCGCCVTQEQLVLTGPTGSRT